MGEHDPEGDQGHCLSDDIIDEEVAAAGQGRSHQLRDPSCNRIVPVSLESFA